MNSDFSQRAYKALDFSYVKINELVNKYSLVSVT